jgi:hypothetical protein
MRPSTVEREASGEERRRDAALDPGRLASSAPPGVRDAGIPR